MLGIVTPLQMGSLWLTSPLMLAYWPLLSSGMVSTLIADAFAGERERHTLETLLATWGVSLVLIQGVRQLFGPQNVEIENPSWLSGGLSVAGAVLPLNRIAIIAFALLVLAAVALLLQRTRLGLFVRGVTMMGWSLDLRKLLRSGARMP